MIFPGGTSGKEHTYQCRRHKRHGFDPWAGKIPWRIKWQPTLEHTPKKDVLFIIGDWDAKVGSQETHEVSGKFGLGVQNEAGQRLIEFAKRTHWSWQTPSSNNTREDSTHGHHQMVNTKIRLIIFFAAKDGEVLYSQQKQDRELTVAHSDHELLIAKFRPKLKKAGKTIRPFGYNGNQIPYDYTVEVRNRFKGLDLIEYLMNYGWRFVTLYRRQESRPSPRKRNAKKQNGCLRRPYK